MNDLFRKRQPLILFVEPVIYHLQMLVYELSLNYILRTAPFYGLASK